MRCLESSAIWLSDAPDADPRWSDHLASCASCRVEADRAAQLRQAMGTLPSPEAPAEVAVRLQRLTAITEGRILGCGEARELLEPYREGMLSAEQAFLMEEHLLWCPSCAAALEVADGLTELLSVLPQLEPPERITERIAMARLPWWQRLWTAPAPSWSLGRLLQVGGTMAAVALLFAVMVVLHGEKPGVETHRKDVGPQASIIHKNPGNKPGITISPTPSDNMAVFGPKNETSRGKAQPGTGVGQSPEGNEDKTVVSPAMPYATPAPVSKALLLIAGDRPEMTIQPRGGVPKDAPVEVATRSADEPLREHDLKPDTDESKVVATARDTLLNLNREDALARSEEELSSLPDTVRIAIASARPEPARPAGLPSASIEEVNRTFSSDLKRNNAAAPMTPIVVKKTRPAGRNDGVLFTITMGSDG